MDGAAVHLLRPIRQGQRQAPVDQAAEQQVKVGSVVLDVGFQPRDHILTVIVRRIVNVLHVGVVQLEDAEADVEVLRGRGAFGFDFLACAADALFADFTDVLVTRFIGFAGFVAFFGKLNHDEFAVSAVLGVELHHGVGGGGRTGEEVEDDGILFRCL